MGQYAGGKKKTERAKGIGRRTRQTIVKWNQMTALIFKMGVGGWVERRHQTSTASLSG